jgi:iron(III) transport system permease protein
MLRRAIVGIVRSVLGFLILAPALALVAAALLDVGPAATVRFSIFPLALAVYDPLVTTSLWHSLVVAAAVAVGSLIVGVSLGRIVAREPFWWRPLAAGLVIAPAVVPPAFMALGLLGVIEPDGPRFWTTWRTQVGPALGAWVPEWAWMAWTWSALVQGVALVALSTSGALDRLDPRWEDAARVVGARSARIWRTLTWPMIRPVVVASVGLVFVTTLLDPAAPLVLGLRRTAGFQVVVQAIRADPFPKVALIVLLALFASLLGKTLLRWLGGRGTALADRAPALTGNAAFRRPGLGAGRPRSVVSASLVAAWAVLAWFPLVGLARLAVRSASQTEERVDPAGVAGDLLIRHLAEPPIPRLMLLTVFLALAVILTIKVLAWLEAGRRALAPGRERSRRALLLSSVPPLAWGAGILAIPRVADLASRLVDAGTGSQRVSGGLLRLSQVIDPYHIPGLLLFLGVCLVLVPIRWWACGEPAPGQSDRRMFDQAIVAGARAGRARRLATRNARGIPVRRIILWATLTATNATPALLLAPTGDGRTLGAGVIVLADQAGDCRNQAAALALSGIAANVMVLGWNCPSRGRRQRPLDARDLA